MILLSSVRIHESAYKQGTSQYVFSQNMKAGQAQILTTRDRRRSFFDR